MVRVYGELERSDEAITIIKEWLDRDPSNSDLNQLHDYMIQINSLQ